jgi:fumarylacetoacetate (FAA) hydrolase
MKIVTYKSGEGLDLGLLLNDKIYSLKSIASSMNDFLQMGDTAMQKTKSVEESIKNGSSNSIGISLSNSELLAPVPCPPSCRDAYAFRQHVATARRNRGVDMIPEFDQFPIFYFTNHNAILGPTDDILCMPDHMQKLDFELEAAIVIGKKGRNIKAKDADDYIAGYLIMNDMSARALQMEEMKLNLGPAKGKDFCTIIGPYLVTKEELADKKVETAEGHDGDTFSLNMKCWVNGELLSEGNMKDMNWTFAEIVERCAYGADILPGDVIGSGTVGTGCLLELNGSHKLANPDYEPVWLKDGDVIEMEIEGLGRIKNKIVLENDTHSLFALKKNM